MAMAELALEPPVNMNVSAYRVLFILLMLVRYRSLNMMELNRHLSENPLIGRAYNSETLTKYINTLREVDCDIPRSTSRNDYSYELRRTPFPLQLEAGELQVAQKLFALLASQPDEGLFKGYQDFVEQLSWSSESAWLVDQELMAKVPLPELSHRWAQFRTYRAYCQAAFTLEITYDSEGKQTHLLLEPHEVVEREQRILLVGMDCHSQQQKSLDVESIRAVRQLPSKNRRPSSYTNVTFALYGRLAKSYRLYPDEKIVYRSETEIHVKARVLETSGLMGRLLKYGNQCQVLYPECLRDSMRQHISALLNVLLNDDEGASLPVEQPS